MDSTDIKRAEIVVLVNAKWDKKLVKEPTPEPKVWTKEKIDVTDIKPKKHEPKHKPKPEVKNTLF